MKISPARKSAFEALLKIEKEKAFSSILLPQYEESLSEKDASLCHELTLGVLRNKLYIDRSIESFTKKAVRKLDIEVLVALRLGVYQLQFLNKIPAYSAINESVNLTKFARKRSASGLVNAVLRRAAKGKVDFEFADEIERVSVEHSHPKWLIEHWAERHGLSAAEDIAKSNNTVPNLTFRFTTRFESLDKAEQTEIASSLSRNVEVSKSSLLKNCYVTAKQSRKLRQLANENLIYFQEEASQFTAHSIDLAVGEKFVDVCASPGSKATYINAFKNPGAVIVAGDFYKHRIKSLAANVESQGANRIQVVQYDAENSLPFADRSFDIVLIDAPCTGTGTIRRNPEIRYSLKEEDFGVLASKQLNILKNASKLLKTGGKMIYSTCSIESEENEDVIEGFLESSEGFSIIPPNVSEKFLTERGFARTYPHRDALDGFFIATLAKS